MPVDYLPLIGAEVPKARQYAEACLKNTGENVLRHLGTEDVVSDLDVLRVVTGQEKLNYLGYSCGTRIGQLYADRFPEKIRAMVLDGVDNTYLCPGTTRPKCSQPWTEYWSKRTKRVMGIIFARRSPRSSLSGWLGGTVRNHPRRRCSSQWLVGRTRRRAGDLDRHDRCPHRRQLPDRTHPTDLAEYENSAAFPRARSTSLGHVVRPASRCALSGAERGLGSGA
ncbi:alpha/beta fold hydrolase [Amycolatopsis sp. NPDC102389]|uniref:alpha/beta fold hydrolase n=1 Tax=Amycolatopsis sp. NPDC102389 TaxID=3363941 RepID=UPI0037F5BC41